MLKKISTKIRKIASCFLIFLFSKRKVLGSEFTFYGGPNTDPIPRYIETPEQSLIEKFISQITKFSIFIYAFCFFIIGIVCLSKKISNKSKIIISSIFIVIIVIIFIFMQLYK